MDTRIHSLIRVLRISYLTSSPCIHFHTHVCTCPCRHIHHVHTHTHTHTHTHSDIYIYEYRSRPSHILLLLLKFYRCCSMLLADSERTLHQMSDYVPANRQQTFTMTTVQVNNCLM